MKTRLFMLLSIAFFYTSLTAENTYSFKYLKSTPFGGYRNYDMNMSGNVAFMGMDEKEMYQIYLFKDGSTTRITNYLNSDTIIVGYIHINHQNQIIWVQQEFNSVENKLNQFVMMSDTDGKIKKLSKKISDWGNICLYTSINDKGEVAWTQYSDGVEFYYIFLYQNGELVEVTQSSKTINFTSINNNGYIVYESQNTPDWDFAYRVWVWNGKEHKLISPAPSVENTSSNRPVIDDDNNIVWYKVYDDGSGSHYVMHSLNDDKEYFIDKPIIGNEPHSNFSDMKLYKSRLIFTGLDNQIYLFDKESLTQLSDKLSNNSPTINDNFMGWISLDDDGKRMIIVKNKEFVYTTENDIANVGLSISDKGHICFSNILIYSQDLYFGELRSTGVKDYTSYKMKLYPNPVSDYLYLETDTTTPNQVLIYNIIGDCVKTIEFNSIKSNQIDVSMLSKGVYIVSYTAGIKQYMNKFVKN